MMTSIEADIPETKNGGKNNKAVTVLVSVLIIAVLAGCGYFISTLFRESDKPKKFSTDDMSIVLTDDFKQSRMGNYAACFDSKKVSVFASKEDFDSSIGSEKMTVEEYGRNIIDNNEIKTAGLKSKDGMYYFVHDYNDSSSDTVHEYYSFVYKSNKSFWIFQFAAPKKEIDKYAQKFFNWAKTVEFAE